MQQSVQGWDKAIDKLRTAAILAVILIHTSSRTLEYVNFNIVKVPWTLILNQSARFAVPLFFLISGFVLELSFKDQTGFLTYLKKRLGKILLPYVFWSLIYYYFVYTRHGMGFLNTLTNGSSSYQLYFIPSLMMFYLIFPMLHWLLPWLRKWWIFLALTGLQIWLLYLDYYPKSISMFDPLRITILNFMYFIIGMVASRQTDQIIQTAGRFRYVLLILCISFAAFISFEGWIRYLSSWNYIEIYSQWRPSIFAYTLCLFAGGYYWLSKLNSRFNLLSSIAHESFLVFFIHVIILEKVWLLAKDFIFVDSLSMVVRQFWWDPAFFILTAGLSFILARFIHKLPWIARLTG